MKDIELGLLGEHQAENACVAWATLQVLPAGIRPDEKAILAGFAATRCPARIEAVATEPSVIVDASHNVASAQALVDVLTTCFPNRRRILILGATTGKDVAGMLRILLPVFQEVICTQYENNPRSYKAKSLYELAKQVAKEDALSADCIRCDETSKSAWATAERMAKNEDQICVTGSFFIAAEVKSLILGR